MTPGACTWRGRSRSPWPSPGTRARCATPTRGSRRCCRTRSRMPPAAAPPCGGALQRRLEAPLRGALGDRVERRAHRLAGVRLHAHHREVGEAAPARATEDLAGQARP